MATYPFKLNINAMLYTQKEAEHIQLCFIYTIQQLNQN